MGKDLTYTLSCSESDLRDDIRDKLKEEYPHLSNTELNRYVNAGLEEIRALGNSLLYQGLVSHGVMIARRNKGVDDDKKRLEGSV